MTDKEKYTILIQRYWDGETTSEEEMELARYVVNAKDPDLDEIRGVLGFLSIGKARRRRRIYTGRMVLRAAFAACIIAVVSIGLYHREVKGHLPELCVRYTYGEKDSDNNLIMSSVESTLSTFFADDGQPTANQADTEEI